MPLKTVAKKAATAVKKAAKEVVEKFTLPKTLAACADLLYTTRETRLKLNKDVESFKKKEATLTNHLIDKLPVGGANGITGLTAHVEIDTKPVATVDDWDALYCFILYGATGWKKALAAHKKKSDPALVRFALLNKAVSQGTVKEMWEAGDVIPGVSKMNHKVVSVTRRKGKK